jgi:hypothetical protein
VELYSKMLLRFFVKKDKAALTQTQNSQGHQGPLMIAGPSKTSNKAKDAPNDQISRKGWIPHPPKTRAQYPPL